MRDTNEMWKNAQGIPASGFFSYYKRLWCDGVLCFVGPATCPDVPETHWCRATRAHLHETFGCGAGMVWNSWRSCKWWCLPKTPSRLKPLQGWFRMSDLEIRMRGIVPRRAKRPSKSPKAPSFIRARPLWTRRWSLWPRTNSKLVDGAHGWWGISVSLKWCTHLLVISWFFAVMRKEFAETCRDSWSNGHFPKDPNGNHVVQRCLEVQSPGEASEKQPLWFCVWSSCWAHLCTVRGRCVWRCLGWFQVSMSKMSKSKCTWQEIQICADSCQRSTMWLWRECLRVEVYCDYCNSSLKLWNKTTYWYLSTCIKSMNF